MAIGQELARRTPLIEMGRRARIFKARAALLDGTRGMTAPEDRPAVDLAEVHYMTLGGARERIAAQLAAAPGGLGRVLDVGTGEGLFAHALAATGRSEDVLGIDPHQGCIDNARRLAAYRGIEARCRFEVATLDQIAGAFDTVTLFLALPDLLRDVGLDSLVASLRARLAPGGRLVISGGFPEHAADAAERLGFALHAAVGYVLPAMAELRRALERAGLAITACRADPTGADEIGPREMAEFLLRENGYAMERGAPAVDLPCVWEALDGAVREARGRARLDARIDTLIATAPSLP